MPKRQNSPGSTSNYLFDGNKWAYLAGIIDGEGCILIAQGTPRGHHKTNEYSLRVTVGMSCKDVITVLHKNFGGTLRSRPNKSYKNIYTWTVYSKEAEQTLVNTLPFLICKLKQAVLGLSFRHHMNNYTIIYGKRVKPEELLLRHNYYLKMRKLKHDC